MKTIHLLGVLLYATSCVAQDKTAIAKPKPLSQAKVDTTSPVTQAEARAVFTKAAAVLKPVIGGSYPAPSLANGTKPVTRAEVVAEFSNLFNAAKPAFKLTPRKVGYEPGRITLKDAKQRANLERLITFGAVAKLGPIAAGNKDSLTVQEFGDSIGFFIARVAELTHMPSAKWTPALQP